MKIKTEQPTFLASVTITLTADDFKDKAMVNVTHGRITDIGRSLVDAKKEILEKFENVETSSVFKPKLLKIFIPHISTDDKVFIIKAFSVGTETPLRESEKIVNKHYENNEPLLFSATARDADIVFKTLSSHDIEFHVVEDDQKSIEHE